MNPRPYGPEPYALPTALRLNSHYIIHASPFLSQSFLNGFGNIWGKTPHQSANADSFPQGGSLFLVPHCKRLAAPVFTLPLRRGGTASRWVRCFRLIPLISLLTQTASPEGEAFFSCPLTGRGYGVRRLGPRKRKITSLTLGISNSFASVRAIPKPNPPCVGAP